MEDMEETLGNEPIYEGEWIGDFLIDGDILVRYKGDAENVAVPVGVARIGKEAFAKNERICSVTLPEGVIEIEKDAFYECSNLKAVVWPQSLRYIGSAAFNGTGLTSLCLPDGVAKIGEMAFGRCGQLVSVVLPEGLRVMDQLVFANCRRLQSITIPQRVERIKMYACRFCPLTRVIYKGTMAQWQALRAVLTGFVDMSGYIYCVDGTIQGIY